MATDSSNKPATTRRVIVSKWCGPYRVVRTCCVVDSSATTDVDGSLRRAPPAFDWTQFAHSLRHFLVPVGASRLPSSGSHELDTLNTEVINELRHESRGDWVAFAPALLLIVVLSIQHSPWFTAVEVFGPIALFVLRLLSMSAASAINEVVDVTDDPMQQVVWRQARLAALLSASGSIADAPSPYATNESGTSAAPSTPSTASQGTSASSTDVQQLLWRLSEVDEASTSKLSRLERVVAMGPALLVALVGPLSRWIYGGQFLGDGTFVGTAAVFACAMTTVVNSYRLSTILAVVIRVSVAHLDALRQLSSLVRIGGWDERVLSRSFLRLTKPSGSRRLFEPIDPNRPHEAFGMSDGEQAFEWLWLRQELRRRATRSVRARLVNVVFVVLSVLLLGVLFGMLYVFLLHAPPPAHRSATSVATTLASIDIDVRAEELFVESLFLAHTWLSAALIASLVACSALLAIVFVGHTFDLECKKHGALLCSIAAELKLRRARLNANRAPVPLATTRTSSDVTLVGSPAVSVDAGGSDVLQRSESLRSSIALVDHMHHHIESHESLRSNLPLGVPYSTVVAFLVSFVPTTLVALTSSRLKQE